jgi:putative ABC transport system permease protein
MGIPLRRGRYYTEQDLSLPGSVVINEALARSYFPNENPVGRRTDRGTIVGVVGDVRQASLGVAAKPEMYFAGFGQIRRLGSTLVVRGYGEQDALANAIRSVVREVSPGQALFRMASMRAVIEESLATPRLNAWLMGFFAFIAVLLAAAGIYGVIAYLVTLRTREFGIRMALGADTGSVLRLVVNRGLALTAVGLAVGMVGAVGLTRVLRGTVYGVSITDPATFGAMAAVLGGVALAACVSPARRAARVDPSVALRYE